MQLIWTIWYILFALLIIVIWIIVIWAIRKKTKYIHVQFVDDKQKPICHATVYALVNDSFYHRNFMGSAEGNSEYGYKQEFAVKLKPIGKTNFNGVFKYTNYLQPIFAITMQPDRPSAMVMLDHINTDKNSSTKKPFQIQLQIATNSNLQDAQ